MEEWENRFHKAKWMEPTDKKLFLKFLKKARVSERPPGEKRATKFLGDLSSCSKITGKKLGEMIKDWEALESTIDAINRNQRYAFNTKRDVKKIIGRLYNFRHNGDISLEYAPPELKRLVSHRKKASDRKASRPVITREEMREMLRFGNTLDKAIISLLFDSGMRMGELVQLRKSDITNIKEGLQVRVPPGKTGERYVIVVEATRHVNAWFSENRAKDKDAPLWISPETGRPISHAGLAKRIRIVIGRMNEARKKEGMPLFNKEHHPHFFRHSRATELGGCQGMTESMMCAFFGWELGSDMPKTYIHGVSTEKLKNMVLSTVGKAKREDTVIPTHVKCRRCPAENPIGKIWCGDCGAPLNSDEEITRMGKLEGEVKTMKNQMEKMRAIIKDELKGHRKK